MESRSRDGKNDGADSQGFFPLLQSDTGTSYVYVHICRYIGSPSHELHAKEELLSTLELYHVASVHGWLPSPTAERFAENEF